MDYLADTVTIIRHFSKTGAIGKEARNLLAAAEKGKHRVHLSVLTLVEIMYLSQKNRIAIDLAETIRIINDSENYCIINLSPDIVNVASSIEFYELFDRLIIATARFLEVPLLTCDKKIRESQVIEVIWE